MNARRRPRFAGRTRPGSLILLACAGLIIVGAAGAHAADIDRNAPIVNKSSSAAKQTGIGSNAGPTLYWYDGERRRALRELPGASLSGKGISEAAARAIEKEATPVFVDADNPGVARALPGGVIIRLAQPGDAAAVSMLLARFDVRVSHAIGDSRRVWLLEGGPGTASIELANAIHESGLVQSASPNWLNPRARK